MSLTMWLKEQGLQVPTKPTELAELLRRYYEETN